jgi:phage protein D
MKPIYKITTNGVDVDFGKRLISLGCNDESGVKSDSCEITLSDRDSTIAIPATGANINVYLGYEDVGLSHIGSYTVNEVSSSGPPDRISIRAHAADFKSTLKEKVSGSFAGQTIGALVESIATKHGLIPKVTIDLANIVLDHINQTNESDMHLLTRLAKQYGAIAKPANGNLVFAVKGLAKSISGISLANTVLDIKQVSFWSYTESKREDYGKVKAKYIDFESGETEETEAGAEGASYMVSSISGTKKAAQTIANTALRGISKNVRKIRISTIGNTKLIAESTITLAGFKPGIPTVWTITKAEHTLNNQGFRTSIEGEIA